MVAIRPIQMRMGMRMMMMRIRHVRMRMRVDVAGVAGARAAVAAGAARLLGALGLDPVDRAAAARAGAGRQCPDAQTQRERDGEEPAHRRLAAHGLPRFLVPDILRLSASSSSSTVPLPRAAPGPRELPPPWLPPLWLPPP